MGALSDVSAERDRAVALLAGGRLEDAITHLRQSVELARTAGDDQAEGEAELLLGRAYRSIGGVGREQDRRADRHVERAEAAFRRAGYRAGRLEALAELAVHAAEAGDDPGVEYFLGQAGQIDAGVAAWWQSYIAATSAMGHDPDGAAAAFLRCLETVDSLPRSAAHWRRECELKLAFLTGGDLGSLVRDTPRDRLMALIRGVADGDGDDLANTQSALEAAERMRLGIQAEAKQRELSATLDLFYTRRPLWPTAEDVPGTHLTSSS